MQLRLKLSSPQIALNKAYLRQSVAQADIERLQTETLALLERLEEVGKTESEEHIKNLFGAFLKHVWYQDYYLNTSGRIDLAIATGPKAKDPIGVIIEAKRPASSEFPTDQKSNTKALQELLLYYLREREAGNNQIRHLVLTNGWKWFLMEENWWDQHAWHNKKLVTDFRRYESEKKTDDFYKDIAYPFFDGLVDELPAITFDLRDYQKVLTNPALYDSQNQEDQQKVTALYKILSPQHLLRQAVINDSNTLNKAFYAELLHIMGLEEAKEDKKTIIRRMQIGQRNDGSLLELTLFQIENRNRLRHHGHTFYPELNGEEKLFAVGMELVITWVNRVLFLKLLEGQLVTYHKAQKAGNTYKFLSKAQVKDFDELAKLFFDVLARQTDDRNPRVQTRFGHIPYLNSSLFEESPLEENVLEVNQLDDHTPHQLYKSTILKDERSNRKLGEINTLDYLFRFLDAYDFGSGSTGEIRPEAKTLINASVLGLIFEKINGYKEGSVYTPGYITMYMCRDTIRRALVQRFNEHYHWQAETFDDLNNHLTGRNQKDILAYNEVVNSLTICDPAVGSGHFLVSALNELIACKSELGILGDSDGKLLKGWTATVENDELLLIDHEGKLFEYACLANGNLPAASSRIQKALFHEKQLLIENCLFGVDINPNSTKICRLRLWIELLKNAYYTSESRFTDLETLPNIDINIKTGNSLLSRFSLKEDLSDVFRSQRFSLVTYRNTVQAYKKIRSREAKDELVKFIKDIKEQFRQTISKRDPRRKKLSELRGQLALTEATKDLFGKDLWPSEDQRLAEQRRIQLSMQQIETEIDDQENNRLYAKGFEWRFEFPEVLDDEGNFRGFDVVVANPPYLKVSELKNEALQEFLTKNYSVAEYQIDLYVLFIEKCLSLIKKSGISTLVTPNSWLKNIMMKKIRNYMISNTDIHSITKGLNNVFDGISVDVAIFSFCPRKNGNKITKIIDFKDENFSKSHDVNINNFITDPYQIFAVNASPQESKIIAKIKFNSENLEKHFKVTRGVNPYDALRGQSREVIDNRVYHSTHKKDDSFVPVLLGKHVGTLRYKWDSESYISYGKWLAAPRDPMFFEGTRIVFREILAQKMIATRIDEKFIIDRSLYIALPNKEANINEILAQICGKLMAFYIRFNSNEDDKLFPKIRLIEFKKLPVINIKHNLLSSLVTQILAAKKADAGADTSILEAEIDHLVYTLYGLTEEEIKIIDSSQ